VKTWKIVQVVGVLVLLLGVIIRAGTGDHVGTGIAVLGAILYAVGRVATWLKSDQP
jgi:hypothetical protein